MRRCCNNSHHRSSGRGRNLLAGYSALAGASASVFGATLLAGGVRVIYDSRMRPPRLPHERPSRWVLPTVGALWVTVSGGFALWQSRRARRGDALGPVDFWAAAVLTGLAVPGVAKAAFELTRISIACRRPVVGDAVIVLGCAVDGDRPSDLLERRLKVAKQSIDLWVREPSGSGLTVICSGGVGGDASSEDESSADEHAEGDVMVTWLAHHGIGHGAGEESRPEDSVQVIAENHAHNTVENIAFSRALLPEDANRVVVVTSDFHVIRVRRLLAEAGLDHWCVSGAYTPYKYWATSTLREFLAQFVLWGRLMKKNGQFRALNGH